METVAIQGCFLGMVGLLLYYFNLPLLPYFLLQQFIKWQKSCYLLSKTSTTNLVDIVNRFGSHYLVYSVYVVNSAIVNRAKIQSGVNREPKHTQTAHTNSM